MKPFATHLAATAALAGAAVALVAVVPLDELVRASALWGVAAAAAVGFAALAYKARKAAALAQGLRPMETLGALMAAQGVAFGARVVAVGAGAFAAQAAGLSPVAFVIAFFLVYLAQQAVEVRYFLAVQKAAPSEVHR